MKKIGIIGPGGRGMGVWSIIKRLAPDFVLKAVCDIKPEEEVSGFLSLYGENPDEIVYYSSAEDMLNKEDLDGVMVSSRCKSHTKYALEVMERELPLYLEKPVSTSIDDLLLLKSALTEKQNEKTVVSFPLKVTPLVQQAKKIIDRGDIGTPEHLYAWNNPSYGDVYYQQWYRDESETGGLWLQKATHDFDYINYLMDSTPAEICAMSAKRIFKGDMPAGLKCVDCEKMDTCKQGPRQKLISANEISEMPLKGEFDKYPKYCSFGVDTGNEDSCSAIVKYESGVIASYNQCFFARKAAGNRGARIIGYDGTLEFDWSTNILKHYSHHTPKTEIIELASDAATHGGGDDILCMSFIDIINGKEKSCSPLTDGLTSCLMCLKAKESCAENKFKSVSF